MQVEDIVTPSTERRAKTSFIAKVSASAKVYDERSGRRKPTLVFLFRASFIVRLVRTVPFTLPQAYAVVRSLPWG